mmetsp:Transcript_12359/g.38124  ORF Transcript_12359/g.38124 Transcript_12359/m.38124 type:complete len:246 (-) Transcript_12359:1567-2304(-)
MALIASGLTSTPLPPVANMAVTRSRHGRHAMANPMRSASGACIALLRLSRMERSTRLRPSALISETATNAEPARSAIARLIALPTMPPMARARVSITSKSSERMLCDVPPCASAAARSLPLPLPRSRSLSPSLRKGMPRRGSRSMRDTDGANVDGNIMLKSEIADRANNARCAATCSARASSATRSDGWAVPAAVAAAGAAPSPPVVSPPPPPASPAAPASTSIADSAAPSAAARASVAARAAST